MLIPLIILLCSLILFTVAARIAFRLAKRELTKEITRSLRSRAKTWWGMLMIFSMAMYTGGVGSIIVFAFASFMLFREFITMTPTRIGDHRALCWSFYVIIPLQYWLIYINWYGLFVIFIPVYVFLFIPALIAADGDSRDFFERTSKIQWALLICVYCVSYAPALLMLKIPGHKLPNGNLLFFMVLIVQVHDVVRQIVDKLPKTHLLIPKLSRDLTVEGSIAGLFIPFGAGIAAWHFLATPFSFYQAVGMTLAIIIACKAATLCQAGIKADWGSHGNQVIVAHGAFISKIFSLSFSAPVFFHLTRFFCTDSTPTWFH